MNVHRVTKKGAPFSSSLKNGLGVFCLLGLLALWGGSGPVKAADLPTTKGSSMAGIVFDDPPLQLPVQRNFQMAMLTASSELGRSCGRIEVFGWRLAGSEQQRVNQIFNSTIDRMREQGYSVESRTLSAVAKDVTLFTADKPDKHLISLWSAGEIGLVMVLCDSSAPLAPQADAASRPGNGGAAPTGSLALPGAATPVTLPAARLSSVAPAQSAANLPAFAPGASARAPLQLTRTGRPAFESFSPLGDWTGTYTCSQGTTGVTIAIDRLKGEQFEGVFRFYPTTRNPYVPKGSYTIFGEYDRDSQRILFNPGKWIEHPKGYANTIIIGSFDPAMKTFSGFFQGIMGCTSIEAKYDPASAHRAAEPQKKKPVVKKHHAATKKAKKTAAVTKQELSAKEAVQAAVQADVKAEAGAMQTTTSATSSATPAPGPGIKLPQAGK